MSFRLLSIGLLLILLSACGDTLGGDPAQVLPPTFTTVPLPTVPTVPASSVPVARATSVPIGTNTPTSIPIATNTPVATNTAVATDTPQATATPLSTDTPLPTNTPLPPPPPTETPVPPSPTAKSWTPEEFAYREKVVGWNKIYNISFTEIATLSQDPKYGDSDWTIKFGAAIAGIQVTADEIIKEKPPKRFATFHSDYVKAANHFQKYASFLTQGVDNLDPGLISQATTEVQQGTAIIKRITPSYNAMQP